MLSKIISWVVGIIVVLTLFPVVYTSSTALTSSGGILATDTTLGGLVGLFPILFVVAGIGLFGLYKKNSNQ